MHPMKERGSQAHTHKTTLFRAPFHLTERKAGAGGFEGRERVQRGGCCVSKDGTLVITAAERAFVPLAYLQDEIIARPKLTLCVPLSALNLKMKGNTMRKNSYRRRQTRTHVPWGESWGKRCIERTASRWAENTFPTAELRELWCTAQIWDEPCHSWSSPGRTFILWTNR